MNTRIMRWWKPGGAPGTGWQMRAMVVRTSRAVMSSRAGPPPAARRRPLSERSAA